MPAKFDAIAVQKMLTDLNDRKAKGGNAPSMWGTDPASIAWRRQQAHVDADIEGLARDPVLEKMIDEWDKAGLTTAQQRERMGVYFRTESKIPTAAE